MKSIDDLINEVHGQSFIASKKSKSIDDLIKEVHGTTSVIPADEYEPIQLPSDEQPPKGNILDEINRTVLGQYDPVNPIETSKKLTLETLNKAREYSYYTPSLNKTSIPPTTRQINKNVGGLVNLPKVSKPIHGGSTEDDFKDPNFDFVKYKEDFMKLPLSERLSLYDKGLTPEEVSAKYKPEAYGKIVNENLKKAGIIGDVYSGFTKGMNAQREAMQGIGNTISGIFTGDQNVYQKNKEFEAFKDARAKEMESNGFVDSIPEKLSQVITEMAPAIASGGATGLTYMGTMAGGRNAQQALDEGATPLQALGHGSVTGAAEALTEKLFGFVPGLDMFDSTLKGLTGNIAQNIRKILSDLGKKAVSEGFEEVLMEPITQASKGTIYDENINFNPLNKETYGNNGLFPLQQMAESGILGGLAGGLLGGGAIPSQVRQAQQAQQEIGDNFSTDVRIGLGMPQDMQSFKMAQEIGAKGIGVKIEDYNQFTDQLKRDMPVYNQRIQQQEAELGSNLNLSSMAGQNKQYKVKPPNLQIYNQLIKNMGKPQTYEEEIYFSKVANQMIEALGSPSVHGYNPSDIDTVMDMATQNIQKYRNSTKRQARRESEMESKLNVLDSPEVFTEDEIESYFDQKISDARKIKNRRQSNIEVHNLEKMKKQYLADRSKSQESVFQNIDSGTGAITSSNPTPSNITSSNATSRTLPLASNLRQENTLNTNNVSTSQNNAFKTQPTGSNIKTPTVYHGTNYDFKDFTTTIGKLGEGIYFTDNKDSANSYSDNKGNAPKRIVEATLKMNNPFVLPEGGLLEAIKSFPKANNERELTQILKAQGYDGVIYKDVMGETEYMVFDNSQITQNQNSQGQTSQAQTSQAGENVSENNVREVSFENWVSENKVDSKNKPVSVRDIILKNMQIKNARYSGAKDSEKTKALKKSRQEEFDKNESLIESYIEEYNKLISEGKIKSPKVSESELNDSLNTTEIEKDSKKDANNDLKDNSKDDSQDGSKVAVVNHEESFKRGKADLGKMGIDMMEAVIVEPTTLFQKQLVELYKAMGLDVVFYKSYEDFADGFFDPKSSTTLFVNSNSKQLKTKDGRHLIASSVGHEAFHSLKFSDEVAHQEMVKFMKDNLSFNQIAKFLDTFNETPLLYKYYSQNQDALFEEVAADEFANNMTDPTFWEKLYNKSKSLFEKVTRTLAKLFDKIGVHRYETFLTAEQVKLFREKVESTIESVIARNQIVDSTERVDSTKKVDSKAKSKNSKGLKEENEDGFEPWMMFSARSKINNPWAKDFPLMYSMTNLLGLKNQDNGSFALWEKAKQGDVVSAFELVKKVSKDNVIMALGERYPDAIIIPVHAEESSGKNKLPLAFAKRIEYMTGLAVDESIVQKNRAERTDKSKVERIFQNVEFDGEVKKGYNYIIVDDVVTQGGTIRRLRDHIEDNGGKVVAIAALSPGHARTKQIAILDNTKNRLKERYGYERFNQTLREFGIAYSADELTESEGRDILQSFGSLDEFRNRGIASGSKGFVEESRGSNAGDGTGKLRTEREVLEERAEGSSGEIDGIRGSTRRKQVKKGIAQEVDLDDVLQKSRNWRSPAVPFFMSRETPERVIEMVAKQDAPEIIGKFISPIKEHVADKARWERRMFERLERMGIKDNLLNRNSHESAAMMKYIEGQYVKVTKGPNKTENTEVIPYTEDDLKAEFPHSFKKIKDAAEELGVIYDEILRDVNHVLTGLGYDPIPRRNNYVAHMDEVGNIFEFLGIPLSAENLPTAINGLTDDFTPYKSFFANSLPRYGLRTKYDAIGNTKRYIKGISNLIFLTEDINRLRILEEGIRNEFSQQNYDKQIKLIDGMIEHTKKTYRNMNASKAVEIDNKIREILNDPQVSMFDENKYAHIDREFNPEYQSKNSKLEQLRIEKEAFAKAYRRTEKEEVKKLEADKMKLSNIKSVDAIEHLSTFVNWLHEYTNGIANKKARLDRGVIESHVGRPGFVIYEFVDRQLSANMVGFNLGSASTNLIPLAYSVATTSKIATAMATFDTMKAMFQDDGFVNSSDFLTRRLREVSYSQGIWGKAIDFSFMFMRAVDWFSSNLIVRSKYIQLRSKVLGPGMTHEQAIRNADDWASRIMADRSKGSQPIIFNSKVMNLVGKFQVEVNNTLSNLYKDIPNREWSKEAGKFGKMMSSKSPKAYHMGMVLWIFAQLLAYSHLLGWLYEYLLGRRPIFDPINIVKTAYKNFNDPNLTYNQAMGSLVKELARNIPFIGSFVGGGRIPITNAIPDLIGMITGDVDVDDFGKEFLKLPYLLFPGGGGQIKKIYEGYEVAFRDSPGVYGKDGDKEVLKYPIADTVGNKIRALIGGKYGTSENIEYFKNFRTQLTPVQTKVVQDSKLSGKDEMAVYQNIIQYNEKRKVINKLYDDIKEGKSPIDKRVIVLHEIYNSFDSNISKLSQATTKLEKYKKDAIKINIAIANLYERANLKILEIEKKFK